MHDTIERLYATLLDREFQIALFGDLEGFRKTDDGYTACCPFHAENTPTMLIHRDRPGYFCFVCGAHGDWIEYLLRRKTAMSYPEARDRLAVEVPFKVQTDEASWREELLLSELLEAVQRASIAELWSEHGLEARSYLTDRGYTQEEIEGMALGLAPGAQSLEENLATEFPTLAIKAIASAMQGDGKPVLSIPYRDASGRLMGLYGRNLKDSGPAAYRPLTDPSRLRDVPFLMHHARGSVQVVVVQGFLDALLAERIGIKGVIGVGISGLTPDLLATTIRYGARRFLLSLDSDDTTIQAIERIHAAGCEAAVVSRPEKYPDTDAYIRDVCINKFGKLLERTVPGGEWLSRRPAPST